MPDYSKTIMYVLKCKDENVEEEYIGHTTNFEERLNCHKQRCCNENGKHYNYKIYKFIRENGGLDNWNMIILEEFSCENKRQAECKEEEVRVERKAQLNMKKAFRTEEQKKEEKNEYNKIYYEKHKEQTKKWVEKNREKSKRYKKKYEEKKKAEKLLNKQYKDEEHDPSKCNTDAS
jgi:hypothetical protein